VDLRIAARYARRQQLHNTIAEDIRAQVPYLPKIPGHAECRLPALDQNDLARRTSRGCQKVEGRGLLVTRHFARFLGELQIEHEEFAAAMLRFLTVKRYVTENCRGGTTRGLQDPKVPEWNLRLFPLHPPKGYVTLLDPLTLGDEWDRVSTCGTCGGSGQVLVTITEYHMEYYTDSNGQQCSRQVATTRQVWQTCGSCGGCGRLVFERILNTHWQRLLPMVTQPEIPMPEFVEDAEEAVFCRVPFMEDFKSLPVEPSPSGTPLGQTMRQSAIALAVRRAEHQQQVEAFHGARLYRADFQVCVFHTICLRFRRLRGGVGWFFGRHPEFYFPRLPLGYGTLGTFVFLPALAFALGLAVLGVAGILLAIY